MEKFGEDQSKQGIWREKEEENAKGRIYGIKSEYNRKIYRYIIYKDIT